MARERESTRNDDGGGCGDGDDTINDDNNYDVDTYALYDKQYYTDKS